MQSRMGVNGLVSGSRRWIVWIIAVCAISAGAYFVVPALVPDRLVQAQINKQIERWSGGAFTLRDDADITVEPGFRVVVSNPAFVSRTNVDAAPVLTTDTIIAPLKIVPLLMGRVEIAELVLLRPEIDLRMSGRPFAAPAQQQVEGETSKDQMPQLGEVIFVDGALRLTDAVGDQNISGLNMRLGADALTEAVVMRGDAFIGPQHLRFDLQLDNLRALVSDLGTQARMNVRVGPRHQSEPGEDITPNPAPPYEIADKLWQAAGRLGLSRGGFGAVTIEGTFSVTPHTVAISDATFSVGGVDIDGHLRAETEDQTVIAKLLSLPVTVNAFVAHATQMDDRRWTDIPVKMAWLDDLDLDIALAGEDLAVGGLTVDTAALSVAVGDRAMSLDLSGAAEGIGQIEAQVALEQVPSDGVRLMATGGVENMSAGEVTQFLAAMGPPPLIGTAQLPEGTMNGLFNVGADGETLGQLLNSLKGSVTAQLTDGSLVGTDLVTTLETLHAGRKFMTQEYGPLIPAAGRTQFDQLDARIDFASGVASLSEVEITGEHFGINMLGEVLMSEGTMNIGGNAVLLSAPETVASPSDAIVDLPFGVGGTLFAPVVAPGVPVVTAERIDAYADDR
ncbi:AsmA-like protein [Yoonia maricola]|uniref:AsmA-like protein n=1 Tax=Yoonia maricola TaxID=420999 RepID=A0A2M8WKQ8_9RHOB|nr:AsmA-like C-terminal region-containing protein [Yoonia maricola]PJI91466.1 AsmA-like protein [Yoonia maricola]